MSKLLPFMMMSNPNQMGGNPMLPMMMMMMGGGGGADMIPLMMNMPRPPMVDPITGLVQPQQQNPSQMMMMHALMGQNGQSGLFS